MNAEVLGVSVDRPEPNRAWAEKLNLPFRLLSDVEPKGKVGKEFMTRLNGAIQAAGK